MILVLYMFRVMDMRKFCYQQIAEEQISLIYKYVGVVSCLCWWMKFVGNKKFI